MIYMLIYDFFVYYLNFQWRSLWKCIIFLIVSLVMNVFDQEKYGGARETFNRGPRDNVKFAAYREIS